MANVPTNSKNPFAFKPIILDQDTHTKRRVIKHLPAIHQGETLQKFFGATVDHLFDPGAAKSINGYIGQRPLWHNPDQDYYLAEPSRQRDFYQLEAAMVSKDATGTINNLLFYPDLINQLRFQGGLVNNEHRLFAQDSYTWCPPIDLDKLVNFRQYAWLPVNDLRALDPTNLMSTEVRGPTESWDADGQQFVFFLPGQTDDEQSISPADFYSLDVIKKSHVRVEVNGAAAPFNYNASTKTTPADDFITFDIPPAAGSLVQIWVYSDVENNVLGHTSVSPLALGGHQLTSGDRIRLFKDKNTDYKPSAIYIVEGVGQSIKLIRETATDLVSGDRTADYLVMGRGAENSNPWSTRNRWFHIASLPDTFDPNYVFSRRAVRPIVEFDADLELYNYGLIRRPHVDIFVDATALGLTSLIAYINQNPTSLVLDGVTVSLASNSRVSINGLIHGQGVRILVVNSSEDVFNNRIYGLVNQKNPITNQDELAIVLETDALEPNGDPTIGELIQVMYGTRVGKEFNWNGDAWVPCQSKDSVNQYPLFSLYDMEGISLDDELTYPGSNFTGNRLFTYQESSQLAITDSLLNLAIVHDNKGDILFENYLDTKRYSYVLDNNTIAIPGYYFHRTVRSSSGFAQLNNDWYKSPVPSKQRIVDRFLPKSGHRTFEISQLPIDGINSLQVWRGRVDAGGNFSRDLLTEYKDFIWKDQKVLISDIKDNDIVEIKTFNPNNPPADMAGFYEVPEGLQSNPNSDSVVTISKGDFYAHFSEIIRSQIGFAGAEYALNNYRDTAKDITLGTHIVQHDAPLLKLMLLASDARLDVLRAARYAEGEYTRFKDRFQRKILSYSQTRKFSESIAADVWIDEALREINLGKTKTFPFFNSRVGRNTTTNVATFIPASPSFLGIYPIYEPKQIPEVVQNPNDPIFIRGHDGSLTRALSLECAHILLALERRIVTSIPSSIKNRERPVYDPLYVYGDGLRTGSYSYDEYQHLLQPSFERWSTTNNKNYRVNNTFVLNDVWTYNWSQVASFDGTNLPGHWRGIFEKYYGTSRPDIAPWEMFGFASEPSWWASRYGPGPYTSDNNILWNDAQVGYIFEGQRKGINKELARSGITGIIPVDEFGALKDPYQIGIALTLPLIQEARAEWQWGDNSPIEQEWRRSSAFPFAYISAGYLMRPSMFVELGWDTEHLVKLFPGETREQWMNSLSMDRPLNSELQVHGEGLDTLTPIVRVGIQQWISDLLLSQNSDITAVLGNKVRGLGVQLAYKGSGFLANDTLVVSSDAFGRVPNEDVAITLYRSPSIQEEFYSGLAIEWTGDGFRIYGYNPIDPRFEIIPADVTGNQYKISSGGRTELSPGWRAGIYYSVNVTIAYGKKFYRCIKTHTSASIFETKYWIEVARPQYADGASLLWFTDTLKPETTQSFPYGHVFKEPQDIANLINGYDRRLRSAGWVFDGSNGDTGISDWQEALKAFITWSHNEDLKPGNVISLSPGSTSIKFVADHGAIQPVEQIVNGSYSIVDQLGKPIDSSQTVVVRQDSEIVITSESATSAIYGLKLYVSEIEHVIVFNNKTIFGDIIYSPLLNIRQPRLRIQGFRTIAWKGRVDSPGFIISGNTITANFERSADDFRRFFAIESMENKVLQDRARANFGYEEREYLNNLLLGPTNQFEFYQGMIQQKGSPTAMRRLLRSSFIQHNKGLKLFEEWAFRVGDYGGGETQPSMELAVAQGDFKQNPQMFEFTNIRISDPTPVVNKVPGVTRVTDIFDGSDGVSQLDPRWVWRPETVDINWPMRTTESDTSADLPNAGFVKLDEVRWLAPRKADWDNLVFNQLADDQGTVVEEGDRVWYYGIDDENQEWSTSKYLATGYLASEFIKTLKLDGTVVALDGLKPINVQLAGSLLTVDCTTNPDNFYLVLQPSYRTDDTIVAPERLVLSNIVGNAGLNGKIVSPKFSGTASEILTSAVNEASITGLYESAGTYVKKVTVQVVEAFEDGSSLLVGTELFADEFIKAPTNDVIYPHLDDTGPSQVTVAPRVPYYVQASATSVPVQVVRTGRSDPCNPTTATWSYKRPSDSAYVLGGTLVFGSPDDALVNDYSHYLQTITVPLDVANTQNISIQITTTGSIAPPSVTVINVLRPAASAIDFVDLSQVGTYEFSCASGLTSFYPYAATTARGTQVKAALFTTGNTGIVKITVDYFYSNGFELEEELDGFMTPVIATGKETGGIFYTWLPTLYDNMSSGTVPTGLWSQGDLIEVKSLATNLGGNGGWAVMEYDATAHTWTPIRVENKKVDTAILTNAAIYDSGANELRMILQTYDPAKGFIPGIADRELYYKTRLDPAVYGNSSILSDSSVWGIEQVGRLWWDLSTVRYLDYEIYDNLSGGVDYRWKHWGRIAPGSNVDVYEWVRSPVPPSAYADFVAKQKFSANQVPFTGEVLDPANLPHCERFEWNTSINNTEIAYYFWVLNVTNTPANASRKLTAVQVANVLSNPVANDIPYFAVIDHSRMILGGIKQFVADQDSVLKVKWKTAPDAETPHHKQWVILREQDERNTIEDSLWNKLRDSLVGWDTFVDATGTSAPKQVPDPFLPKPQQLGNLVRPRQSWFPTDIYRNSRPWPSRDARFNLVDTLNDILSRDAYTQIWFDWQEIFRAGEPLPAAGTYTTTALDLADLNLMLAPTVNAVQVGNKVLVQNTAQALGFWTLWECIETNGKRSFKLVDFQKWKMQEGYIWQTKDWFAKNWSAADFPTYRFTDLQERNNSRPTDYALLKGTLVEVENHLPDDGIWTWYVLNSQGYNEVGRKNGTLRLTDVIYNPDKIRLNHDDVSALLQQNITPETLSTVLTPVLSNRDGSMELEWLLNSLRTRLFDVLQKNELFFSMVKSAFKANRTVDWAFKTSFLYLGGYSEELRQSPVAFKDQIDNVVAYLEEVKPYHVKIREYVRRLSYGPDVAKFVITDFDKPVYLDRSVNPPLVRTLDINSANDVAILKTSTPWSFWFANYQKTNYNPALWDKNWNPIRRMRTRVMFDRTSCAAIRGWNTSPWDPSLTLYSQRDPSVQTLSALSTKYRAEYLWDESNQTHFTDALNQHARFYFEGPNRFGDRAVDTIADRDNLLRSGLVTTSNQGTICVVRADNSKWMWTGRNWAGFDAVGWEEDVASGAAGRIERYYAPLPGMVPAGTASLIEGCDFAGTVVKSKMRDGVWDMFEWDSTGWSSELSDRVELDPDLIVDQGTGGEASDILMKGNGFAQPGVSGKFAAEQMFFVGKDFLNFTVKKKTNGVEAVELRLSKNQTGKIDLQKLTATTATIVDWNQSSKTITINVPGGVFPFYDPNNPTKAYLDAVSNMMGYYSSTANDMTLGAKTFVLNSIADDTVLRQIPRGLVGANVKVVLESEEYPTERMIGTVTTTTKGSEIGWDGNLHVTIDGYVGTPLNTATTRSRWNIIPLDLFSMSGQIWIGQAKVSYSKVSPGSNSNEFILNNALVSGESLAGVIVSSDHTSVSLPTNAPVYDASMLQIIIR